MDGRGSSPICSARGALTTRPKSAPCRNESPGGLGPSSSRTLRRSCGSPTGARASDPRQASSPRRGRVADSSGRLPALAIPGLPPDNPGDYLASLGLLRSLAREWPSVRIAWREDILHVVGGPVGLGEPLEAFADIGGG